MSLFRSLFAKLLPLSMILCLIGCQTEDSNDPLTIERWRVASASIDCEGVIKQRCLLYQVESDPANREKGWQRLYSPIENFTYQPGYEYILQVAKEPIEAPAADQSQIRYTLIKEVAKLEKRSRNLPPSALKSSEIHE